MKLPDHLVATPISCFVIALKILMTKRDHPLQDQVIPIFMGHELILIDISWFQGHLVIHHSQKHQFDICIYRKNCTDYRLAVYSAVKSKAADCCI